MHSTFNKDTIYQILDSYPKFWKIFWRIRLAEKNGDLEPTLFSVTFISKIANKTKV